MNNRSFANRLTWRIIGIVSGIFIISFIVVGVAMQYISTNEETTAAPWRQILDLILIFLMGSIALQNLILQLVLLKTYLVQAFMYIKLIFQK